MESRCHGVILSRATLAPQVREVLQHSLHRGAKALKFQILSLRRCLTLVFRSGVLEYQDLRRLVASCHAAEVGYKTFLRKQQKKLQAMMTPMYVGHEVCGMPVVRPQMTPMYVGHFACGMPVTVVRPQG